MSGVDYVPVWRLRQLVGSEEADILFEAYGGTKIYIPANPREDGPLARLIGIETAKKLAAEFASGLYRQTGCTIEMPMGETSAAVTQRRLIQDLICNHSLSNKEIMRRVGVTERSVRRWRSRFRGAETQMAAE